MRHRFPITFLLAAILGTLSAAWADLSQPSPQPGQKFIAIQNKELASEGAPADATDWGAPPDTTGAVGPAHVVSATNFTLRIQTRLGAHVETVNWMAWWATARNDSTSRFYFDPRVAFDPSLGRWIMYSSSTLTDVGDKALRLGGMMHLALSHTDDPTGDWTLWDLSVNDVDPESWFDQPRLGFGSGMVAVTVTTFSRPDVSGTTGTTLFVLSDIAGAPGATVTAKTTVFAPDTPDNFDSNSGVPCPAHTAGGKGDYLPMLTFIDFEKSIYGLSLLVQGTDGKPYLAKHFSYPEATNYPSTMPAKVNLGNAPQLGTTIRLEAALGRIESCFYRSDHDRIWAAHGAGTSAPAGETDDHVQVQWLEMGITGDIKQVGRVGNGSGHAIHPSLAVNKDRSMLLGYTVTSPTIIPAAAYNVRFASDPAGCLKGRITYQAGGSTYTRNWDGRCRWGDYSATVVDPVNDASLWTCQEFSPPEINPNGPDRYGTVWARVLGGVDPPVVTTQPPPLLNTTPGGSVTMTVAAVGIGLTWQWFKDGAILAGRTSPTLTLVSVAANGLGQYRCRVTNGGGSVYTNGCVISFAGGSPGTFNLAGESVLSGTQAVRRAEGVGIPLRIVRQGGAMGTVKLRIFVSASVTADHPFVPAQQGLDYLSTNAYVVVTFLNNEVEKTITIQTIDDGLVEQEEGFGVQMSYHSLTDIDTGASLGTTKMVGLIQDNDPALSLEEALDYADPASNRTWSAGAGWRAGRFSGDPVHSDAAQVFSAPGTAVSLSADFTGPGTLVFDWRSDMTKGADYAALRFLLDDSGTNQPELRDIKPWSTRVVTIGSGTHEARWEFTPAANEDAAWVDRVRWYPGTAGVVEFASTSARVSEDGGTVSLRVNRLGQRSTAATVQIATGNSTAVAPGDYVATTRTVTFGVGETQQIVDIPISPDALVEDEEVFTVRLSSASAGSSIGASSTARVTIEDSAQYTYDAWASRYFTITERAGNRPGAKSSNPDNDEGANLIEFATGNDPRARARILSWSRTTGTYSPAVGRPYTADFATVSFTRDPTAVGVRLIVERSTDLVTWQRGPTYTSTTVTPSGASLAEVSRRLNVSSGLETVVIRETLPLGTALSPKSWLRLRAEEF